MYSGDGEVLDVPTIRRRQPQGRRGVTGEGEPERVRQINDTRYQVPVNSETARREMKEFA